MAARSAKDFGAAGDGRADDTAAFQRALDAMSAGGTLHVPPGTYRVNQVRVQHRNLRVVLAPKAIIVKRGPAGVASRGIFVIDGLIDAAFVLTGGTVDLNGEGPLDIGRGDRISSRYDRLTVPTVIGIAGPPNAAVYALRSSGISVTDVTIRNSSENGLLFRNCGKIVVRRCRFSNLANYGIEFSIVRPEADGGTTPIPQRNQVDISECYFEDIDDFALGSGNGCGIGGGGVGKLGGIRDYRITDCTFVRCQRDIHFEFHNGSWMEQVTIARIASTAARQGSIGLVSVRYATVRDVVIDDPGSAPTALLIPSRPELYGIVLSTGTANVVLTNIVIRDRRQGRLLAGGGASIARSSTRLKLVADVLEPGDTGSWVGIRGGNPMGSAYVGRIRQVLGPREAELERPAGATVRNVGYAIGGFARNGIIMTASSDITLDNVVIEAGSAGDPASIREASAIRMWGMTGEVRFAGTVLRGPKGGNRPAGIRIGRNRARLVGLNGVQISGFVRPVLSAD